MTQVTTAPPLKVKFATQLAPDLLASLRDMARTEGRQLQSILDEALREYLANRQKNCPRSHVLGALQVSMAEHDALYKALSK
jgi:hypothetical protein